MEGWQGSVVKYGFPAGSLAMHSANLLIVISRSRDPQLLQGQCQHEGPPLLPAARETTGADRAGEGRRVSVGTLSCPFKCLSSCSWSGGEKAKMLTILFCEITC